MARSCDAQRDGEVLNRWEFDELWAWPIVTHGRVHIVLLKGAPPGDLSPDNFCRLKHQERRVLRRRSQIDQVSTRPSNHGMCRSRLLRPQRLPQALSRLGARFSNWTSRAIRISADLLHEKTSEESSVIETRGITEAISKSTMQSVGHSKPAHLSSAQSTPNESIADLPSTSPSATSKAKTHRPSPCILSVPAWLVSVGVCVARHSPYCDQYTHSRRTREAVRPEGRNGIHSTS